MNQVNGSRMQVIPSPWIRPGDTYRGVGGGGRPCIIAPDDCEEIICDVCEESLPQLSVWTDGVGKEWRVFELPGGKTNDSGEDETVRVTGISRSHVNDDTMSVVLKSLPKSKQNACGSFCIEETDDGHSASQWEPITESERAARTVDQLISLHLDFVNRLYDSARTFIDYWEGQASGLAIRPARRTIAEWMRGDREKSQPRMALIVKLARDLEEVLSDVCRRPRQVLRRVREMQRADKLQELDAACLRWIARQPGITLLEKAGAKQELLGVVRIEDADTPENRVVRDLLLRLMHECQLYLREHHLFFDHTRVRLVRHLQVLVRSLWQTSPIVQAGRLVELPNMNYVLQHEHRYNVLWNAYVMLVRKQKQQDSAWRWRHRVWAEQCWFALLAALRRNSTRCSGMKSDLLLRDEQVAGRFIDPDTQIGTWIVASSSDITIHFIDGRNRQPIALIPQWLQALCPDVVLIADNHEIKSLHRRFLAIWCVFSAASGNEHLELHGRSLSEAVKRFQGEGNNVRCLLLEPYHVGQAQTQAVSVRLGEIEVIRLSIPLQEHLHLLANAIQRGLQLP